MRREVYQCTAVMTRNWGIILKHESVFYLTGDTRTRGQSDGTLQYKTTTERQAK
jgi:hypothetical protein